MTEPAPDPGPLLTPADLAPFATIAEAKAEAMIDDALGMAVLHAPCITKPEFAHRAAAKAIVRGAILRWNESGGGAIQSQTTLSYGQTIDTRQPRRTMFFPSEIDALKDLCRPAGDNGGAFSVDMLPPSVTQHALSCSLRLGGDTCSCGANLTGAAGFPLWETHPEDGLV